MPKKRSWLYRLFNDHFEVTIWWTVQGKNEKKVYHLQHLKKMTNNHLKGIDLEGHKVEMKTLNNFDYTVIKHY
jgi:hypothetical protein